MYSYRFPLYNSTSHVVMYLLYHTLYFLTLKNVYADAGFQIPTTHTIIVTTATIILNTNTTSEFESTVNSSINSTAATNEKITNKLELVVGIVVSCLSIVITIGTTIIIIILVLRHKARWIERVD